MEPKQSPDGFGMLPRCSTIIAFKGSRFLFLSFLVLCCKPSQVISIRKESRLSILPFTVVDAESCIACFGYDKLPWCRCLEVGCLWWRSWRRGGGKYVCMCVRMPTCTYVEVVHSSTQLLSIPLHYIFRMESMDRGIDLCTNVFLSTIADSLPGTLLLVDWRERVFGLLLPILHYRISISIAANHDRRARLRSSRLCSFAAVTIYTFSSPYKN